jgi:hypothetical protein
MSHAASAFYPIAIRRRCGLDGVGEWATASFNGGPGGLRIHLLKLIHLFEENKLLHGDPSNQARQLPEYGECVRPEFFITIDHFVLLGLCTHPELRYKELDGGRTSARSPSFISP